MHSLLVILLAFALLVPGTGFAQSGTAVEPAVGDSIPAAAAPAVKKKKGMFGKVKGLAKNKIVKTVGKAALCTVVPGGQVIAGALDAAETKSVEGAASTVATGGNSCMPGMGGMAGSPGAGAAGIGAAGVGAGVVGAVVPGQPSTGMPGMAMSPEQMKQMQEQYAKMGIDASQMAAMQQMMAGMPTPSSGEAGASPASQPVSGAPGLSREKGRLLVRQLPWLTGSDALQPGGEPMFGLAMQEVAAAIRATGKRYKIEARVEDQGEKGRNRLLAQKRAAAILAALSARGVPADRLSLSDGKNDKDPRIIVSESK